MYYVVYVSKRYRLSVRPIGTLYPDAAINECLRLRQRYEWKAYRLMFDDGTTTTEAARWSADDYVMAGAR